MIRIYDYEGHFLQDVNNLDEASAITGATISSISRVTTGVELAAKGFQFRRLTETNETYKKLPSLVDERRGDTQPIAKYWNGRLICVYNSLTEAAEKNLLNKGSLSRDLNNPIVPITGVGFSFIR